MKSKHYEKSYWRLQGGIGQCGKGGIYRSSRCLPFSFLCITLCSSWEIDFCSLLFSILQPTGFVPTVLLRMGSADIFFLIYSSVFSFFSSRVASHLFHERVVTQRDVLFFLLFSLLLLLLLRMMLRGGTVRLSSE
uniref:Uncharacterized protein n=1 Tax=Trypanosoma congolense (strain IL3000) TaxID=1068625 RepID=G0UUH0_TRYCI|nr:hypothetical protein, unlikely [Trypanosoma congolense IL3000]